MCQLSRSWLNYYTLCYSFDTTCGRHAKAFKPKELTHAWAQVEQNLQNDGKLEQYLEFDFLEQYPQLMEPGSL